MPKPHGGDIMDSTNEIIDVGKGLIDIFSLDIRVRKEKEEYGLTDKEALELKDAYLTEDQTEPGERIGTALGAFFRQQSGMPARRSSQDILDTAKARKIK